MLTLLQKIKKDIQIHVISKKKNSIKFAVTILNANNGLNTIKKINVSPNNDVINTRTIHKISLKYSEFFKYFFITMIVLP